MPITKIRMNEIERKVEEILLDSYGNIDRFSPPVDLSMILKKFGFKLKSGNFEDEKISGAYDKKTETIFLSESQPYSRKAFTVAHELGHYFLHNATKEQEVFYRFDSFQLGEAKPEIEIEADYFAANLLMPRKVVEQFWPVLHDVDEMAQIFNVSSSAMQWRLKNLNLNGG